MMRSGRVPEHRAVEGAVQAMAMTMTTVRVRSIHRAVGTKPRKARVQWMAWGNGRGRQQRTGRGRGREMVKGKVLLNKPHKEMMTIMALLCSCRRKCMRQTRTWRAN
jgi:hypothetical protein